MHGYLHAGRGAHDGSVEPLLRHCPVPRRRAVFHRPWCSAHQLTSPCRSSTPAAVARIAKDRATDAQAPERVPPHSPGETAAGWPGPWHHGVACMPPNSTKNNLLKPRHIEIADKKLYLRQINYVQKLISYRNELSAWPRIFLCETNYKKTCEVPGFTDKDRFFHSYIATEIARVRTV
jgi:hypothetical protein